MPSPGAHRRKRSQVGRHRAPSNATVPLPGLVLAGCLVGSTVIFTSSGSASSPPDQIPAAADATATAALLQDRLSIADEKALTRSLERAAPSPSPSPTPEIPEDPTPVAGLVQAQMNNAATIVRVGRSMDLPRRALIIGVMTAMQESNLYNVASNAVPESFDYPHEGSGSDHDSVGLFQQRPSQGWGTVENLMKPEYQARNFFNKLVRIDWQNMSLTLAAQAVQVSAFPYAYAKHEPRATIIVDALI